MRKILLDTSVLIDYFRRNIKEETQLNQLILKEYSISTSIIAYAELYAGKGVWEHSEAEEELETLFLQIDILPIEKPIARIAGRIRASYGNNLLDAMIAATAIHHKLELVTLNTRDFAKIKGLKLFQKIST